MQIVIDISEEMYQTVKDETYCGSLYEELKNGTPLPKKHGRLIDADTLYEELSEDQNFFINAYGSYDKLPNEYKHRVDEIVNCVAYIMNASTVIEGSNKI